MTFIVGQHRKFVLAGHDTLDPTKVTGAEQILPLGYLWTSLPGIDDNGTGTNGKNQGTRTWVYIKADGILANGQVVARVTGDKDYVGDVAATGTASPNILGVAQYAIAAGEYGFIMRDGVAEVAHDATLGAAANGTVVVASASTAGRVDNLVASGVAYDQDEAAQRDSVIGTTLDAANNLFRIHCTG